MGRAGGLCALRLATSKLLANADRQADDGVSSRDLIDLAMMDLSELQLHAAVSKAEQAYGQSICSDLAKTIDRSEQRVGWLYRCMQAMAMETPRPYFGKKYDTLGV